MELSSINEDSIKRIQELEDDLNESYKDNDVNILKLKKLLRENVGMREAYDTLSEIHEDLIKDYIKVRDNNKRMRFALEKMVKIRNNPHADTPHEDMYKLVRQILRELG